jgi:5'-3' exonuclease
MVFGIDINMNGNPTFIFIDGSYYCFYRYYSLVTWWKNAYPDTVLEKPYDNPNFLEKFKKTFIKNIEEIPKKLHLSKDCKPIIIAAKDCKRENIWRTSLFPEYKANRDHANDHFEGGPFFKMVYEENLFQQGGTRAILKHSQLEADDCIAISVKHVLHTYPNCTIYIITSDKDYLQLLEPRVKIFNLAFKNIAEQKSCSGNPECDLFCKIVMGDPSDNIKSIFPKCGIKTALKYFQNKELFKEKVEKEKAQEKLEFNTTLIDFNKIPQHLISEFYTYTILKTVDET